jgi:hypothetical protein
MMMIGVDYRPSFQTIAFFIAETGECGDATETALSVRRSRAVSPASRIDSGQLPRPKSV